MNNWLRFFQFRNYSLRTKLLVSFLGITLVATGTLAGYAFTSTTSIHRDFLNDELTERADEAAIRTGDLLNEQINRIKTFALNEVLEEAVEESNESYTGSAAAIQAEMNAKDAQWRAANNDDPLVREFLTNQAALELREFQEAFPDNVEIFITDVYGAQAGTVSRTSDYYQADEDWWQAAFNNGQGAVYIGQPEFDESVGALAVQIAVPIRNDESGEITGILRTTYLMSALNRILDERVGQTGRIELYIPGGVLSRFRNGQLELVEPAHYAELQSVFAQGMVEMNYENIPSVVIQAPVQTLEGNPAVNKLGWMIVYHQQQIEAFAPVNAQVRGALFVMVMVVLVAVAAAVGMSLFLVKPIIQLTKTAEEISSGSLHSRAVVTGFDEIGILASTFNSMTSQLQETLQGLEQRVADRTKALATSAEISRRLTMATSPRQLAVDMVEQVQSAFQYYHAHIYFIDEASGDLILAGGTGEAGATMLARGHKVTKGRGLVGRAAETNAPVHVPDVTQTEGWLPNPLLPETKSEVAVPISSGGTVFGVLDVQHKTVNGLSEEDVTLLQSLASQAAISLQNSRTYEQSRARAELESLVNAIGQKIQSATSVEDTLQTAVREIGLALGAPRVSASLQLISQPDLNKERMA